MPVKCCLLKNHIYILSFPSEKRVYQHEKKIVEPCSVLLPIPPPYRVSYMQQRLNKQSSWC